MEVVWFEDSNLGHLDEKGERYLYAMQPPSPLKASFFKTLAYLNTVA